MALLNTIFHSMLDIVFPIKCVSCGKSGRDLCEKCLTEAPSGERENEGWIVPLYDYRHPPIKKALHSLKYKGKKRLAKIFAEALYEKIMEELSELSVMENFRDAILIPIPLSKKRRRERGYNQTELICREIIKINSNTHLSHGVNMYNDFTLEKKILIKPKETEHQARIKNRQQRLENIIGSFAVKNPEKIKNQNIILIDDITTTGATLSEARKTLRHAGARKVIAFAVAH